MRLASFARLIVFDKRGTGMSDPVPVEHLPTLEERMDDVRAVMQAAASTKAVLFAYSEGGAMGALYTATYPALVERLVMVASMARFCRAPDYPHMPPLERVLLGVAAGWGTVASAPLFAPSRSGDGAFCERLARFERQTASPSAMRRLIIANDQIDVRAILPQIRRPTLIIQRRGDRVVRCGNGRYLADHVPDAVYLELPGEDHLLFEGDMEAIVDAVVGFALAEGARESTHAPQRFLSTVLFTDIVGSTELAGELGDRAWRDLLQRFHALCRVQIDAFRGREIDTAGAGLHTGEVETLGDKVSGMAVHIGARVMSKAGHGEVWVSSTARDLVAGSGIGFEDCGTHALKGVPGEWSLHRARVQAEG
jgi:pimeloyl-ACP methyl ester carboxylesterase